MKRIKFSLASLAIIVAVASSFTTMKLTPLDNLTEWDGRDASGNLSFIVEQTNKDPRPTLGDQCLAESPTDICAVHYNASGVVDDTIFSGPYQAE